MELATLARRLFRRPVAHSQSDEAALLATLLARVDVPHTFCEFGFDAHEFNCAGLVRNGWRGLLIDGNAEKVAAARGVLPRRVQVECAFLTRETIRAVIEPIGPLGVLSIDVDGNDYWFLQALLPLKARLILCEYNASFLHERITIPYDPTFDRRQHHPQWWYHGASLAALTTLARATGYELVGVSAGGLNAAFARRTLALPSVDPAMAYRENALRNQWSHSMAREQWETLKHLPYVRV